MSLIDSREEEHVAWVTLSRPDKLNAISGAMAEELAGAFARLGPDVRATILAASGDRAFCVGADLKERNALDDGGWMRNRIQMRAMFSAIRRAPMPTIASVFGYALGGGFELALSCDLIVAADDAVFGLPETRVGIIPGGGGTQLLPRRVGPSLAKEIILAGRRLDADEAREVGLVVRVVPRAELDGATADLARSICANSPLGVRQAKLAIDRGAEVPLEHGVELEELGWRRAVAGPDRREGIAAFNEKREPRWTGE